MWALRCIRKNTLNEKKIGGKTKLDTYVKKTVCLERELRCMQFVRFILTQSVWITIADKSMEDEKNTKQALKQSSFMTYLMNVIWHTHSWTVFCWRLLNNWSIWFLFSISFASKCPRKAWNFLPAFVQITKVIFVNCNKYCTMQSTVIFWPLVMSARFIVSVWNFHKRNENIL